MAYVEATVGYRDGEPSYAPIPEDGVLLGVTRTASIRIHFDRFLLPSKIVRQALCIRPSLEEVASLEACTQPAQAFVEPDYSPARRMVTLRLSAGDRLQPMTRYRVTLFVPQEGDAAGFFAFDGAPLGRRYQFDFETQPEGGDEVEERQVGPESYCAAVRCFEACDDTACEEACRPLCVEPSCEGNGNILSRFPERATLFSACSSAGCHGPTDPEVSPDPSLLAMGFDLYTVHGVATTAIGKTAHQTQHGEASQDPRVSGLVGRAMPRIDPSHPGNSYLLYKLLANPYAHPRPGGVLDPNLREEIERLRAAFVVGLPMPAKREKEKFLELEADPFGEESFAEVLLIETWIAHGAVTTCQ